MNQLRLLPVAFICGLTSTPAFAQLTTIGPNTPGVSEFTVRMTTTLGPGCSEENPGGCIYFPTFTPIQPLQSGGGGSDTGFMAGNNGCFGGCAAPSYLGTVLPPSLVESDFNMFEVTFDTAEPVTRVIALGMQTSTATPIGSSSNAEVLAFDGQQIVADCGASAPGGCFTDTQVIGSSNGEPFLYRGNLTVSAPNITSVWIGNFPNGTGGINGAQAVQFAVPEPATLGLLGLGFIGLGLARRKRKH